MQLCVSFILFYSECNSVFLLYCLDGIEGSGVRRESRIGGEYGFCKRGREEVRKCETRGLLMFLGFSDIHINRFRE